MLRRAARSIDALSHGHGASVQIVAPHPFERVNPRLLAKLPNPIGFRRPGWQPSDQDQWIWVATEQAAAEWLAHTQPGPALVAVGNARLSPFYALRNQILFVRSRRGPHPPMPPQGGVWVETGPFDAAAEQQRLHTANVAVIVAHDAGGGGGWPKLAAARNLGIPVVLLRRPDWEMDTIFDDMATLRNHLNRRFGLDLPVIAA